MRAYSHMKMQKRKTPALFEKLFSDTEPMSTLKKFGEWLNPNKTAESTPPRVQGFTAYGMTQYGEYGTQIKPFMEIFGRENIHLLDGGNLLKTPNQEYFQLEKFFNVSHSLKLEIDAEKGFPCLKRPVPMCLGSDKGEILYYRGGWLYGHTIGWL